MLKNLLLIFLYIIFVTIAQIMLKLAMNSFADKNVNLDFFLTSFSSPKVLVGMFLYVISFLIWLVVLSKVEITFAYPLLSLSVILVAIISWTFMEETFNLFRIIGMMLTILGAWLVVRS